MKGLVAFRWLMPAVLVALLSVPVQTANPRGMGGGGGHMGGMGGGHMGGMGGGHMGGRVRMGGTGGLRSHPGMATHFFSRTGASRFAQHQNLAFRNPYLWPVCRPNKAVRRSWSVRKRALWEGGSF